MPSSYNALLDMVYRELTDTLAATFYRSPVGIPAATTTAPTWQQYNLWISESDESLADSGT